MPATKIAKKQTRSSNRGKRFPAEPLSRDDVLRLLKACSRRAPTGVRNRALITVLYRGGLRLSESLSLMPKDFDSDEGVIRVLHGKGDRQRTVAVDPEAASVVQLWIERRAKLGITNKSRLFSTLAGGPINPAYIRALFKRLGWRAGLDRRVHAHALRHGFATELVAEGTPINIVSMLLGHSSVSTTAIYVQHLHPKQAIDTVRQRGPWLP